MFPDALLALDQADDAWPDDRCVCWHASLHVGENRQVFLVLCAWLSGYFLSLLYSYAFLLPFAPIATADAAKRGILLQDFSTTLAVCCTMSLLYLLILAAHGSIHPKKQATHCYK